MTARPVLGDVVAAGRLAGAWVMARFPKTLTLDQRVLILDEELSKIAFERGTHQSAFWKFSSAFPLEPAVKGVNDDVGSIRVLSWARTDKFGRPAMLCLLP
jgi:hypothetical protein